MPLSPASQEPTLNRALAGGFRNRQRDTCAHLAFFLFHAHISLCYQDRHDSLISQIKPVTSSLIAYPKAGEL